MFRNRVCNGGAGGGGLSAGATARRARWAAPLASLLVLAPLLLFGSCAGGRREGPPNVILVSFDTVRADMLGCYGCKRPTSPVIDRLAAEGVLFENTVSSSPWTLPAHASLLTGLYPNRHGARSPGTGIAPSAATWAEVFKRRGYTTKGIVNADFVGVGYGFDRGFDEFENVPRLMSDRNPSDVFRRAVRWLETGPDEPYFLCVHTFEVHSDYASLPRTEEIFTGPYRGEADGSTGQLIRLLNGRFTLDEAGLRHIVDLYAAGIRQADNELGRLVRFLEERGELDRTLLVILSDHGEEFLEHGGVLHGRTLFDELLRIPLVMRGPGARGGLRPAEPASIVDVLPTVLGLLDLAVPPGLDGVDLGPAWRGEARGGATHRLLFGESDPNDRNTVATRSVRAENFKLVYDGREDRSVLYDLAADPGESADASGRYPAVADSLAAALDRYAARNVAGVELPEVEEKVRRRLRGLGYLN